MKILIAYDGSVGAESAIDDLLRAGLPQRAEALVLTVAEELMMAPASLGGVETTFPAESLEEARKALAHALSARARICSLFPAWEVAAESSIGSPGSSIIERADRWKPDLIVVGSHGRSALGRILFGSVSQKVASQSLCSVRVARGREVVPADLPVRLIVGVDGSEGAEAAVREVASRCWPPGSEVHLVNAAWILPPAADPALAMQIAEWVAEEKEKAGQKLARAVRLLGAAELEVTSIVGDEYPITLLCQEAEKLRADSIFVGARGMGRLERVLIGSVSAGVAARAHCSVEIVRG